VKSGAKQTPIGAVSSYRYPCCILSLTVTNLAS
jgi:hypothetical protein